ncbi:MAG: hypothetical protein ABSH53_14030 [Holophaga sp.]|jgi:YHS domain-containing protein
MLHILLTIALAAAPAPKPATNTVCPVTGAPVDAKCPAVVVHGQQYRLCCMDCAPKLEANPKKYLKADGTPKNAR